MDIDYFSPPWNLSELDPEYLEKSKRIYRQPSFFDIEAGREELESPERLKFYNFPREMEEIAKWGLKGYETLKRNPRPNPEEQWFYVNNCYDGIVSKKSEEAFRSLSPKEQDGIRNNREWPQGIPERIRKESLEEFYRKVDSIIGKEFDPSDSVLENYARHSWDSGGGSTVKKSSKCAMDHLRQVCKGYHEGWEKRMQKIRKLRPWLVEFSEKYGDMLGVTFAGNGYRAIKGDEGTVFFKPEDRYRGTFKVKPELEKQFFESITDVIPLGKMKRPSDEMHLDFNGCLSKMDAYLFKLSAGTLTIGYLDRDFAVFPNECEGWFLVANPFDRETVEKNRMHPWSHIE